MLLLTGIELLAPMLHMVVWRSRPLEHIVWSDFVPVHHFLSAAKAGGLHQKRFRSRNGFEASDAIKWNDIDIVSEQVSRNLDDLALMGEQDWLKHVPA